MSTGETGEGSAGEVGAGITVLSSSQLEQLADMVAARMAKNPVHLQPGPEKTLVKVRGELQAQKRLRKEGSI